MLERIVTGAAGAVVAVIIVSVLTKFTDWISGLFGPTVPDGAVVTFLHPCEEIDGWEDYADGAGKFLLGAGKGVLRPRGPHQPQLGFSEMSLSEVKFGDQGGQEVHTLTIAEMPSHNHDDGTKRYLVQKTGTIPFVRILTLQMVRSISGAGSRLSRPVAGNRTTTCHPTSRCTSARKRAREGETHQFHPTANIGSAGPNIIMRGSAGIV